MRILTLVCTALTSCAALRLHSALPRFSGASVTRRTTTIRMGFEVEDVDERAVGEMGVFSWPGLEKRKEDFKQSASSEEMTMVYVKEGTATISDAEESKAVKSGQMVMISDGEVQWSGIGTEGLTLISLTTELSEVVEEEAKPPPSFDPLSLAGGAGPGAAAGATAEPEEEIQDLTPGEAVKLLGYGLAAGFLAAFGLTLIQSA